ncbi:stonustoxin subunit alpha-like [Thunnus maccoyii]|uniref:stonustoxin subunit alpha-like n=1 Tax=Thunnus maccoyii TaxID=8240 RepID=UPI001C4D1BB4|nr:stonustoxin subunit alpha-like [Thunnus maccoyii]
MQCSMEAVIKKIPSFNFEGKADIKLTKEEKALTEKFSCKFYGDIIFESNPATFEGAVKTYVLLPKLLGENVENGVPLKVWMMPLKNLDPTAAEVKNGFSVGLVRKAQNALEDLHPLEKGCNDFLEEKVVNDFPKIREKWHIFQTLCVYFRSILQETMEKKLPLIRAGEEDESKLQKIIEDRDKSPFSHEKLTKWMDDNERQINIIRSCVEMMEGIKIIPNQSELDEVVFAPGIEDVLCSETTDPYPQAMADYLDSFKSQGAKGVTPPTQEQWYYSDQTPVISHWIQTQQTLNSLCVRTTRRRHGAKQSYPGLPQRFDYFHQVMCREELTVRCYWEVEWSVGKSEDVAVGVSYKGMFWEGKDDQCRL